MISVKAFFIRFVIPNVVGLFFGFFIRNNNKVFVTSAQDKWGGNCKYAVKEIQRIFPEKKVYWAVTNNAHTVGMKDHDVIILNKRTYAEKYHLLTAKYIISDGFFYGYLGSLGAVNIDFWHGIPFKFIGLKQHISLLLRVRFLFWMLLTGMFKKNYHLCQPSSYLVSYMQSVNGFFDGVSKKYNSPVISPIVDVEILHQEINSAPHIKELYNRVRDFNKVYLYAPTYRDLGGDFLSALNFDLKSLQSVLKEKNEILILRLHPWSNIKKLPQSDNVIFLDDKYETEIIIGMSSVVITDYSSIYFNALVGNKGIILMHGDKDRYIQERGLDRDIMRDVQGEIINDFVDFEKLLKINKELCLPDNSILGKYYDNDSIQNPCKFIELIK